MFQEVRFNLTTNFSESKLIQLVQKLVSAHVLQQIAPVKRNLRCCCESVCSLALCVLMLLIPALPSLDLNSHMF